MLSRVLSWVSSTSRKTPPRFSFHVQMSTSKKKLEHLTRFDFESKKTWQQNWTTDNPGFHRDVVTPMLIKQHYNFTRGRKNLRILVPLCGKMLDMMWLADQGHSVVGVELIRKGIEAFLHDNKLTHCEETITSTSEIQGTIFKANERDISFYECSIFDFSAEIAAGQFDLIWDRGSMTAINMMKDGRLKQYRDIMLACLKPDGRYFLEFFRPESFEGMPPTAKFISEMKLTELFSDRCMIQFLGKEKLPLVSMDLGADKSDLLEAAHAEVSRMMMYYYFMDFKQTY